MKFRAKSEGRYGKRHKPGEMNQTEAAYAEWLQGRKLLGEIAEWRFEAVTFKLADDTRYTPDFQVLFPDGLTEFVDTKSPGPIDAASLVKIKCAAEKFYEYTFVIEQRQTKKDGGGFKRREF